MLALAWAAITIRLMLSPSGDGITVTWVSRLFGGTETTDAIGHVIINCILAFLWCWIISQDAPTGKTVRTVFCGGTIWSFAAELSQFFVPERGSSLGDRHRSNMKPRLMEVFDKLMLRKRAIIETIHDQLKNSRKSNTPGIAVLTTSL